MFCQGFWFRAALNGGDRAVLGEGYLMDGSLGLDATEYFAMEIEDGHGFAR